MIRVTLLIENLSLVGGAERLVAETAARLDRTRFEPEVWVTRPLVGMHAEPIRRASVPIHALGRRSKWHVTAWRPLYRRLRETDVLHSHIHWTNVYAAILGRLARVPVIVTHEHTWSWEGDALRRLLDRHVVGRLGTLHLAVSEADRRQMVELERIPAAKTRYLPIGIPGFEPSDRDVRAEFGIAADAPVVGTVCGLRPQKALDVLVDAAARLREEFAGLVVLIGGDGPERERLERLVADRGLGSTVRLLGRWPEPRVPELLATLDVAVNCSDFEGSPLGVMEFMAAARPIVATRVGGTPDLIDDGVHGLLVPPRAPAALAAATARLLREREYAAELARRARERQRAEFDIDVFVRRLEELYLELARRAGRV